MTEKIGKYEIEEKIGVGGFGVVYKGRDPYIKRPVAIKTCQVDEEEIKKRFFREAEFAGNLRHPNITTIYDFGIEDEIPYIVLEFLTGEDLDKKIKRGDYFSIEEKLRILIEVCKGLHYAHENNIIHRDIKPANIRIQDDGSIKIMDFGIAKSTHIESHLTQTGMTLGTAAYLAPEQIRGELVDRRTDIFSLGVLMYEFFTYKKPFQGEIITNIIYNILNVDPPQITSQVIDFPQELEKVVFKCIEKDREKRYSNVQKVQNDLELILKNIQKIDIKKVAESYRPTTPFTKTQEEEKTAKTPTLGFKFKRKNKYLYVLPIVFIIFIAFFLTINKKPSKKIENKNIKKITVINPLKIQTKSDDIQIPDYIPPIVEEAKQEVEKPKPIAKTYSVSFFANVGPCDIFINNKFVGTFPPEVRTELPAGNYEILYKTNFLQEKKYISVEEKGSNRFGHQFPQMGKLRVLTKIDTPYGSVYVDGKYIGETPQANIVLPVGIYKVEVKRAGYVTKTSEIEIKEGQVASWTVTLIPEN